MPRSSWIAERDERDEVAAQFRVALPATIQFVISDRGVHVMAHAFTTIASGAAFIHVPIAMQVSIALERAAPPPVECTAGA